MSSTMYETRPFDTFESVARKVYGDDQAATRIQKANPGVQEPIAAGTVLFIPPQTIDNKALISTNDPLNVAIRIEGSVFKNWTEVRLTLGIDIIDTVEVIAPFEPNDDAHRALFKPFSFKAVQVQTGDTLNFNGTLVGVVPQLSGDARTVELSAYSLPGVLQDCTAPASSFPLEFNGLTLESIAVALLEPFGIEVEFDGPVGAAFERVAVKPTEPILTFLANLAKQRNLVVTNTPEGRLLFLQSEQNTKAVANFTEGSSPLYAITPFFSPQSYYSHITGIEVIVVGFFGSQHTVRNPRLAGVLRPYNFQASDVTSAELKTATEAKAGRMFANMVTFRLEVATWRDANGALWAPNTFVSVEAPGAMVYTRSSFLIRSVQLSKTAESETAVLDVVLPGAFSGQAPEVFPWD